MISSTMTVNVSQNFWEPVRRSAVENILGYFPKINSHGAVVSPPTAVSEKPIITYISRQGGARRLSSDDHESLINALKELESTGLCQVFVAEMEKMTLKQQIEVMAKSTVRVSSRNNSTCFDGRNADLGRCTWQWNDSRQNQRTPIIINVTPLPPI